MLDSVANELLRAYPTQIIGVEGHTDSDSPQGSWVSNHQVSIARAGAVFDYLTTRGRMRPQQLFLVGHGANHPVVSNASAQGKAQSTGGTGGLSGCVAEISWPVASEWLGNI